MPFYADCWSFDSILVRLKDQDKHESHTPENRFRFHTGSIKRRAIGYPTLKDAVSIPYWFD